MENPASLQAVKIKRLFDHFNLAAAAMLLLVIVLVAFICFKFRRRGTDPAEGAQTTGNGPLEAVMIGVPVLLLAWFFYESVAVARSVTPTEAGQKTPDIIVTGHQWWWEVQYPGHNIITANVVHLPAGRHLLLELRSADVIHDWWVPELGNKTDLIPGNKNYLALDIQQAGDYTGACSEFCGAQHAWMRIHVIAQDTADYNRWLDSNSRESVPPADPLAREGASLFMASTCAGCHRIAGTTASAAVGPDLTHLGSRQELLTGILPMNESNLIAWISHPQQIKPGSRMPDFILPPDSVKAIAHYLEQLK
jgi:cytochrome c oxidase subunit 2